MGRRFLPDVVARFADQFGPVLYNLYGSTEVGYASVAAPADLAAAPTPRVAPCPESVCPSAAATAGVAARPDGRGVVGSAAAFDGYVDGADKPRDDGLVATGDLGLLDETGLLFIRGRADDLIISGGENVHPTEVESVLRGCPAVVDVAAVGRPDSVYGQAVVAFVVSDAATTPATVRRDVMAYAREHLAPYQRPQEVRIVDHLPATRRAGRPPASAAVTVACASTGIVRSLPLASVHDRAGLCSRHPAKHGRTPRPSGWRAPQWIPMTT